MPNWFTGFPKNKGPSQSWLRRVPRAEFNFTSSSQHGQANSSLLDLMKKTGYTFQQKNGQRIFGPPSNWTGPPPQKGSEVFIAKLPRYVFEDELMPLFSRAGTIYQMRLMVDFSGSTRGFGFVQFSRPSEALASVMMLNNCEIRPGKFIGVIKSIDNRRVYVGNLPKDLTKSQLVEFFTGVVDGIVDVIVYQSVVKKPFNRGFVFLEFSSHTDAAIARRKLKLICLEPGKQIIVDWAIPLPDVPDHIMKEVKILYVRNLLLSTSETTIYEAMSSVAGKEITKVKKINDFAFVHFMTRQAAEKALHFWNERVLDGSIIEVTWAKPPQKSYQERKKLISYSGPVQVKPTADYSTQSTVPSVLKSSEGNCLAYYPNIYQQAFSCYDGANSNYFRGLYSSVPINVAENVDMQIPWSQSTNLPPQTENFGNVNHKQQFI